MVLVTSYFCQNVYKGGVGVKCLNYLRIHTLWMGPYRNIMQFQKGETGKEIPESSRLEF